jgi:hypothetical protein
MTIRQLQLIAPVAMTGTLAPYATVPSATTYRIGRLGFANNTAAAVTVRAALTVSGTAVTILPPLSVPAGRTYVSPELAGFVMPQGSTLQASGAGVVIYAGGQAIT